ncbi:MAG TPA: DUF4157 domain-containing protein [Longimicrobium sp.]|nr:DUF4157 domain-containing protein [Longimicrobium sp.]
MRTHVQKPDPPQPQDRRVLSRLKAASPASLQKVLPPIHDSPFMNGGRTIRNADGLEGHLDSVNLDRVGHDFSRISVHATEPAAIRPKLMVSTSGDRFEQEADHVSELVATQTHFPHGSGERGSRTTAHRILDNGGGGDNWISIRPLSTGAGHCFAAPPVVQRTLSAPGEPLQQEARSAMEPRFGHDFSRVRVHTDRTAAESAAAIGALAYTAGHHIVFGKRQDAPTTQHGRKLLAHELTHVLQQSTGSHVVVQRQADNGTKAGRKKDPSFVVKEGKIEQKTLDFTFEYSTSMYQDRAGRVAVTIELGYTRESSSKYADPSKLNWFQTLQTNYITDASEVPPTDTAIKEYVDGCVSTERQDVCFAMRDNGSVFTDGLFRHSLPDRDVYFKAETSAIGISDSGLEILGTVEWGFQMDRKGNPTCISLRQVEIASPYHLRKFQELRVQEE